MIADDKTIDLDRTDVAAIDHPNSAAIGGLILAITGLITAASGGIAFAAHPDDFIIPGVVVYGLWPLAGVMVGVGVPVSVWGFSTMNESEAAAEQFERPSARNGVTLGASW